MFFDRFTIGYLTGATVFFGIQKALSMDISFWGVFIMALLIYMVIKNIATNYIGK